MKYQRRKRISLLLVAVMLLGMVSGLGAHTHAFAYEASGATITATCSDPECGDSYSLTLLPPEDLTCDGEPKPARVEGTLPENVYHLDYDVSVTYHASIGGEPLSGAPSEPGDYVAQMSWGGANAVLSYTLVAPQTRGGLRNTAPIQIGTLEELKKIGADDAYPLNGSYILTANIDGMDAMIGGNNGTFSGTFDGNGYTITLSLSAENWNTALFPMVTGTVKNLKTAGTVTSNSGNAAGIIGDISSTGTIENCWNDATVTGGADVTVGGIVAHTATADPAVTVINCCNTGTVSHPSGANMNGIVGYHHGQIINCFSTNSGIARIRSDDKPGTVTNSYYAGTKGTGDTGTQLSGNAITDTNSYSEWDFENTWIMTDDGPRLRAFQSTAAPAAKVGDQEYTLFMDAVTAWNAAGDDATLTLLKDVETTSTVAVSGTKTLDLGGHGIRMTGSGSVISVGSDANLTLEDSDTTTEHKFTVSDPASNGAGLATVDDTLASGYQTFTGGYITGGSASNGGGINVQAGGYLTMNGGTIIGNQSSFMGAGVRINMSGDNTTSPATMNGGAIMYNKVTGYGAGVNSDGGFTMTGGTISHNYATIHPAGIHCHYLYLSGGRIENNYCGDTSYAAGAHADTQVYLSGAPVVSGNVANGIASNLDWDRTDPVKDTKLTITGALTEGAKIGVTLRVGGTGVFTDSANTDYNDASKFTSDAGYAVVANADKQLELMNVDASVTTAAGATQYYSFSAAVSAWNSAGADATLTLLKDVTTSGTVNVTGTKTLDLNSFNLSAVGAVDTDSGRFNTITLEQNTNANLTVTGPGKVTGGYGWHAGGIYVGKTCSLILENCEISGNTGHYGGGLYVAGTATLKSGTVVTQNQGKDGFAGSGAYVEGSSAKLILEDDATFTANVMSNTGQYAVFLCGSAAIQISGAPVIYDNAVSGVQRNLYFFQAADQDSKIQITDALTDGAKIGVGQKNGTGAFTNSDTTDYNDASLFTSDNDSYIVGTNADGQLLLGAPCTVTYAAGGATGTVPTDSGSPYAAGASVAVLGKGTLSMTDSAFAGWKIGESETVYAHADDGIDSASASFTISGNATLTAQWTPLPQADTPEATFTATGSDSGTLSGLKAGMQYSLDGSKWTDVSSDADVSLTGLSACTIQVVMKGDGTATLDSETQSITVTKAETPDLTVTQPAAVGENGSVSTTTAHEYSADDGETWTACTANQSLAPGSAYLIRVKAAGTVLASEAQSVEIETYTPPAPPEPTKQDTPEASFTATGADSGTLSGLKAGMQYSLDGSKWTDVDSDADVSLTGLSACTIQIVMKGDGTNTVDSDAQSISVTKAETPDLTVTQPTAVGGNGSVSTTTAHEYSADDGETWTACAENQSLAPDATYLIRVKAEGTVLASEAQSVEIEAFIPEPTKQPTPEASFTATGPDSGTLRGLAAGMKFSLDGSAWTDVDSDDDVSLTGLGACTIQVVMKGDGTNTLDSDAQSISVTKAETPELTVTQPEVLGENGSVNTTAAHEYSADDGKTWTACAENQSLEPGYYLIRVKASGAALASDAQTVTVTKLMSKEDSSVTYIVEGKEVTAELDVSGGDTPDVEVGNLDVEAKAQSSATADVKVTMSVESKAEEEIPQTEAEAMKAKATDETTMDYLRITIEKTEGSATTELSETQHVLEIIVPYQFKGKVDVAVYRYHGGAAQKLRETTDDPGADGTYRLDRENGLIYIYAKEFSTYAIGYTQCYKVSGRVQYGSFSGEVSVTLQQGNFKETYTGMMSNGVLIYSFNSIPQDTYDLIVTWTEKDRSVMLAKPVNVNSERIF